MIERFASKILWLALICQLGLPLYGRETAPAPPTNSLAASESGEKSIPVFHPIEPGPLDGRIAFVTARMLEQNHYTRQRFDSVVSSNFLDRYLESFDPSACISPRPIWLSSSIIEPTWIA